MGVTLIADSGGSKTDWRLVHENGERVAFRTPGFNLYNQPLSALKQSIEKEALPHLSHDIQRIFFYSAGATSQKHQREIEAALRSFFPKPATIHVHSDLLGAARALCGNTTGIACILGTGSNCGSYDGTTLCKKVPSLGWILSDEGSGSYLGKRLVSDYLNKTMPVKIADLFHHQYPWDGDQFLQKIYKGEQPARFLGSFSPFIAHHIEEPYCHQLVYSGFEAFYKKNVMVYDNYQSLKVHFTGSIAFHYKKLLKQTAKELGITVGRIIKFPIDELVLYHQKQPTQK